MKEATTDRILDALAEAIDYAPPDGDDLLAVLVRAILSQATNKTNRDAAFESLLAMSHGDWRIALDLGADAIADAIRIGGLAEQKSKRIHHILQTVSDERGEISLEFVKTMEVDDALAYLLALPGVGLQSATFALGWSAGRDLCPVNTGVKRVATRLGWLTTKSANAQHRELHKKLPDGRRFEAHMLLVRHARTTCGLRPSCAICACEPWCEGSELRR